MPKEQEEDWLGGLTRESFPHIAALLEGPDAETIKEELRRLVPRAWRQRAPRHSVRIMARLCVGTREEIVMVRDVSWSGVRVAVAPDFGLDVMERDVHFVIRVATPSGPETLNLPAVFVRVASVEDGQPTLAFQFSEINETQAALLERLSHLIFA
jgi:hypothetical protein